MPLHDILHACYMTLKIWEVLHVMACNLDVLVITCNYMHYMSLHAIEDANEETLAGEPDSTIFLCAAVRTDRVRLKLQVLRRRTTSESLVA